VNAKYSNFKFKANHLRAKKDLGAAVQNMLLAAYAQGLGTCWMGVADTPYEEPVKKLLGVPENSRVL